MPRRVAIIGAGLAGLACARELRRAGFFVEVFDRAPTIGGRIATMRMSGDSFDHGAQYVTARSEAFTAYLDEIIGHRYAERWLPRAQLGGDPGAGQMQDWYVGTPGMASFVRPLAEGVRIHTGHPVHSIERRDKGWHIWFEDETSVGPFHVTVLAVPAPQALMLMGRHGDIAPKLARARLAPCWAVMIKLNERCFPDQDVFSDMSEVIRWISRNNTKPRRTSNGEAIVVHASPSWTRETEDVEPDEVAEELWNEVCKLLQLPPVRPARMTAHLWTHGLVEESLGETFVFSSELMLGLAGDWCLGRMAEHAFTSGYRLGRYITDT